MERGSQTHHDTSPRHTSRMFCFQYNVCVNNHYCLSIFVHLLNLIRRLLFDGLNFFISCSSPSSTYNSQMVGPVNIIPWICLLSCLPSLYSTDVLSREGQLQKSFYIMRKLLPNFPLLLFLILYLHGSSGAVLNTQLMPNKRMNSQGFLEDSFNHGFGGFSTMKKKKIPEQKYEVSYSYI